jgi:hypothetical protein
MRTGQRRIYATTRLGITPDTVPPTPLVRPSQPLCDVVRHDQRQSRGTVPPTPVRPTRRTLERGRLLHAHTGLRRDVGPTGPVTSVALVLCGHPRRPQRHPGHCITISYTVGGRGDKTPPRRLLCSLRPPVSRILEPMYGRRLNEKSLHRHPRSRSWTDTRHAMTPRQMQDLPGRSSTPQRCTPCLYT